MTIITRKNIIDKLLAWKESRISEEELESFSDLYILGEHDVNFEDWIDDQSASFDVMSLIAMMDLDLYCKDDVDKSIQFLKSPINSYASAKEEFFSYIKNIDKRKRALQLADNPYYAANELLNSGHDL